jgi:hypothetical protein
MGVGYSVVPVAGIDFTRVDTTQEHKLGSVASDEQGREYMYVLANGAFAVGDIITPDGSFDFAPLSAAGIAYGVAISVVADNSYGWIQTKGQCDVANLATSTADNAQLERVTDANGDLVTGAAVTDASFAKALAAESGGTGAIWIL